MVITSDLPEESIVIELGARIAAARLQINLTQAELATLAGISKRSLERLESGEVATRLSSFISVCGALGLIDRVESLVPAPSVSPMTLLKLQGRKRQRAARPKKVKGKKWTWGDEE